MLKLVFLMDYLSKLIRIPVLTRLFRPRGTILVGDIRDFNRFSEFINRFGPNIDRFSRYINRFQGISTLLTEKNVKRLTVLLLSIAWYILSLSPL
jgi:hypothetical protein